MKKKLLSLMLVAAMALAAVACGSKEETAEAPAAAEEATEEAEAPKTELISI